MFDYNQVFHRHGSRRHARPPAPAAYRVSAEVAGATRERVVQQVRRHGRSGALALLWPRGVVERAEQNDLQGSLARPD